MTKNGALELALEALDSKHILGCGEWRGQQLKAITAIKEALAQPAQEPHNFCPRCGKRLEGVLGQPQVHTCTPPLWGHK